MPTWNTTIVAPYSLKARFNCSFLLRFSIDVEASLAAACVAGSVAFPVTGTVVPPFPTVAVSLVLGGCAAWVL